MTTVRYYLGILLVTTLPPAVVWWFIIHPFIHFWRRVGAKRAFRANIVIMLATIVGLWFVRRPLLGRDLGTHWGLVALGAVLLVVTIALGRVRRRQLTAKILSGIPELQEDGKGGRLLTEGLYAHVRHPRYIEVALGIVGYAALANFLGGWIMAVVLIPSLHGIVLFEERELARRFGSEYDAYRARVPRYIPRRRSA